MSETVLDTVIRIPAAAALGRARRGTWLAFTLALAACSGGGSVDEPPRDLAIESFRAERSHYFVGESAVLTARFSGGAGRIEPDVGDVQSGVPAATPPLTAPASFRLVVEGSGRRVERWLSLPVAYRDRYRTVAQEFRAARHTATLAADGTVLIIGGARAEGAISAAVDRFDPGSHRFARIGTLATGRENHTATRLADGRILVVGGNAGLAIAMPAELVDERTGAVTATGPTVAERRAHTATPLADGRVLVTGGYSNEGFPYGISDTAELFDPVARTFRPVVARLAAPRAVHTATPLADGRVLLVGGISARVPYVLAEVFDPATESFAVVPTNAGRSRSFHEAVRLADGSVLVAGGEDSFGSYASVLRFRPATTSFEVMPNLLRERSVVRATVTPDDRVLLFGGEMLPHFTKLAAAELYTPAAGGFDVAPLPEGRSWHSVTRLADGRVLIVGGEGADGAPLATALLYE